VFFTVIKVQWAAHCRKPGVRRPSTKCFTL